MRRILGFALVIGASAIGFVIFDLGQAFRDLGHSWWAGAVHSLAASWFIVIGVVIERADRRLDARRLCDAVIDVIHESGKAKT